MSESGFLDWLVKVLLSWSRWLSNIMWGAINAEGDGGFFTWFENNWLRLAFVLLVVGVCVDWLVWMVRWRPYWLWFNKKQIIYAENGHPRGRAEDPFAVDEEEPAQAAVESDPFAPKRAEKDEDFWRDAPAKSGRPVRETYADAIEQDAPAKARKPVRGASVDETAQDAFAKARRPVRGAPADGMEYDAPAKARKPVRGASADGIAQDAPAKARGTAGDTSAEESDPFAPKPAARHKMRVMFEESAKPEPEDGYDDPFAAKDGGEGRA